MAKERKKVEPIIEEPIPVVKKRLERKLYIRPIPKIKDIPIEEEIIIPEIIIELPKTRKKTPLKKEPIIEVIKSKPKKTIVKKEVPKGRVVKTLEKVIPIKKLTKKQIEKQNEQEKEDLSVPQVLPKKNEPMIVESIPKVKRSEDKYISVAENAKMDERKIIADKVFKNELVFSHYSIDNDIGYHYYRVLTK